MSHANARLTPAGRLLMVRRVEAGMPQAHVASQMGLSRGTVAKWWHRYRAEGEPGLADRSSRPHRSPRRTDPKVEERVCRLRRSTRRGPVYLAARTGVPQATVWRILKRNGLSRLSWIDRPTGQVIRRYERAHPGESWSISTSRRSEKSRRAGALAGPRPGHAQGQALPAPPTAYVSSTISRQHKAHQAGIWRCDAAQALPRLDAAEPAVLPHRKRRALAFYCKRSRTLATCRLSGCDLQFGRSQRVG